MKFRVTIFLVILVLAVFLAGMLLGPVNISPVNAVKAVLGEENELVKLVLIEIRLPRVILSLAIGASLGLSGAALQGLLQNPLAEPALLGAGPAAAFGEIGRAHV